ncbi:MAG: hypothetical protein AAF242_11150, partial [Bacteroidota bacterium]
SPLLHSTAGHPSAGEATEGLLSSPQSGWAQHSRPRADEARGATQRRQPSAVSPAAGESEPSAVSADEPASAALLRGFYGGLFRSGDERREPGVPPGVQVSDFSSSRGGLAEADQRHLSSASRSLLQLLAALWQN